MTNSINTAAAAVTPVRKLAHVSENFAVEFDCRTFADLMADIKAAGFVLGEKSLRSMIKGEKTKAGDFEVIEVKFKPVSAADKKAAAEAAKVAKKAAADAKAAEATKAAEVVVTKPVEVAPPAPVAPVIEDKPADEPTKVDPPAPAPAAPVVKAKRVPVDFSHLIAKEPQPVLRDSVIARLFERLCQPEGASKKELMEEFSWSEGGFGGIIHWEPKARGYQLGAEKVDGVLRYRLQFVNSGGRNVLPSELLYRDKKVAAVAAPKAPKAVKEVAEPKARIPKADVAGANPMMGASVTRRRAVAPAKV